MCEIVTSSRSVVDGVGALERKATICSTRPRCFFLQFQERHSRQIYRKTQPSRIRFGQLVPFIQTLLELFRCFQNRSCEAFHKRRSHLLTFCETVSPNDVSSSIASSASTLPASAMSTSFIANYEWNLRSHVSSPPTGGSAGDEEEVEIHTYGTPSV